MKVNELSVLVIGIIAIAALAGYLSSRWLKEDNIVEEIAEEVIAVETGAHVDLSPNSPECKKVAESDKNVNPNPSPQPPK